MKICVDVLFVFFCYGFVLGFELSLFGLLRYCSYANLFWLTDSFIIMCWFP